MMTPVPSLSKIAILSEVARRKAICRRPGRSPASPRSRENWWTP
jgi:hypothetical protein